MSKKVQPAVNLFADEPVPFEVTEAGRQALTAIPAQPTAAEKSQGTVHPFPALKPGHRLVPAKVARSGEAGVIVFVECPNWCVEDHVAESVVDVADVMHRSVDAYVYVPTFGYGAAPVQMHAWIESDPVAKDPQFRAAHVSVTDAGGNAYCHLTPEQAEKVADDLIGFASEIRHQARTARLANQATVSKAVSA